MGRKNPIAIIFAFLFLGTSLSIQAQVFSLNVNSIPDSLKKNADVVIRKQEKVFEVHDESNATEYVSEVVTILNPDGDFYSYFVAHYDKFSSISNINIYIYDDNGKLIKDVDDIDDISANDGFTIYSDSRLKLYKPNIPKYPYTVVYNYKKKYKSILSWRGWNPVRFSNISVENSSYKIITPTSLAYQVKESNLQEPAIITNDEDGLSREYKISSFKAYVDEGIGSNIKDFTPWVIVSPDKFNYGGYEGSYKTWSDFSKFIYTINSGRDEISPELKNKIEQLTSNADSDLEKAKLVYEFMQDNTRYVSIQYGVGGHQPMFASEVEENGYGDCKALSNYTYSLLNHIGVEAKYSLIKAGRGKGAFSEDIPHSPFNHVILCLPNKGDTLWLECTSQKNPFGYLGDFTGNRKALIIDEEGGKLVNTTRYSEEENVRERKLTVDIFDNGSARSELEQKNYGIYYDDISFLESKTDTEQKKYLYRTLSLNNLKINDVSIVVNKDVLPQAQMNLKFELQSYARPSSNRLFLPLNMLNVKRRLKSSKAERKGKIRNEFAFVQKDSIVYNIPEGYEIESKPRSQSVQNEFGEVNSFMEFKGNQIIYYIEYHLKEGEYDAELISERNKITKAKYNADRAKVVLVKKSL